MQQEQKLSSIFARPLVKEITLVLCIKLALIFFIKWQFFSDPVDLTQINNSVEAKMGLLKSPSTITHSEKNDG